MSTISASTTLTTAYSVTGDTTGTLVFKTGASPTTAMTLGADQSVTFAGAQTYTGAATFTSGITVQGLTVGKGAGAVASNTAVGASALAANTTGAYSVAIGYNAGLANQSGVELTLVGFEAGKATTGSGGLTAVGVQSGLKNTTGIYNSFIGGYAGKENTTGSYSVALGYQALQANTTASNNTAVGYQAGYSQTTQTDNVFIGYRSGYTKTGGSYNTFVGDQSGLNSTSGGFNTFIGHYSGATTTGDGNTFVGLDCGYLITTGSKNTIIGQYNGNEGGLDIRTANNYIVLSDGDGNPTLISTGNGSVSSNHVSASGNSEFCLMRASLKKWFIWNDGNTNRLNITPASFTSGVYLTDTATSWAAYSDRRIKSDIVDLEYGLSTVMAMQPRRYIVTANGENSIGFIAQELKEVLPEAVVGEEVEFNDEDTPQERSAKTMGVAKDNIIPVLVKAIQELKAEFDAYKATHP